MLSKMDCEQQHIRKIKYTYCKSSCRPVGKVLAFNGKCPGSIPGQGKLVMIELDGGEEVVVGRVGRRREVKLKKKEKVVKLAGRPGANVGGSGKIKFFGRQKARQHNFKHKWE